MSGVPKHLEPFVEAVSCAYPLGVAGDPYLCLLTLLDRRLDERDVASTLAVCFDMERVHVRADLRRARGTSDLDEETMESVRESLESCGLPSEDVVN